jgi:hypothetical protein
MLGLVSGVPRFVMIFASHRVKSFTSFGRMDVTCRSVPKKIHRTPEKALSCLNPLVLRLAGWFPQRPSRRWCLPILLPAPGGATSTTRAFR